MTYFATKLIDQWMIPLFDTRLADDVLQLALLRDPTLISTSAGCMEDVPDLLKVCASKMGLNVFFLDVRLLLKYPGKVSYAELCSTDAYLSTTLVADIASKSPCLLYIQPFDSIFQDPAQQHSTSAEDSLSVQLYEVLRKFMYDLYDEVDRSRECTEPRHSSFDYVNPYAIAVVIATQHANKLSAQWLSFFGARIDLPWAVRRDSIFTDTGTGTDHCDGTITSTDCTRLSHEEEDELWAHVEAQQLGRQQALELIRLYRLGKVVIDHLSRWTGQLERGVCSEGKVDHINAPSSLAKRIDRTITRKLTSKARIQNICQRHPHLTAAGAECTFGGSGLTGSTCGGSQHQQQQRQQDSIASVRWGDIGGLDRVRKEILDVLELPFKHPDLFHADCPRRQGVLLYGPPGTGKTLVARAVATECGMSFISVKGPELLDMYVGESEKNVRDVFQRAQAAAPCVLFFDEIDSLAPARAKGSGSGGGVMDRMVSQLLTEMDMLVAQNTAAATAVSASATLATECAVQGATEEREGKTARVVGKFVFIIAATNRPDLLDPALLRPGRFDRKIYLGVCKDTAARVQILAAQTRKFLLHADVDLTAVATTLPPNVTGADIGALSSAAYGRALEKKLQLLREGARLALLCSTRGSNSSAFSVGVEILPVDASTTGTNASAGGEPSDAEVRSYVNSLPRAQLQVRVAQEDFLWAAAGVQPSVTDLNYYESMGDTYNDA